ncbi:MAG: rod shape-determining protein MreD [Methylococcaceae bacterium]|nr:rod shape-determining protein MreD [Methylococcaceae bacterium]
MQHNNQHNTQRYLVTLLLAMCLKILPLPVVLNYLNPDWVLLVLIYWTLATPERVGVFNALVIGILVDVLTGRLLGQHALIYALISYTCLKLHKRLRHYPVPQQALFIFLLLMFSQMMMFWIENIQAPVQLTVSFWVPVFTGTILWPLVYSGLRYFRIFGFHGRHD